MNILIKAFSSDEYAECECTLVRIDESLAKKIAAARKQLLAAKWEDALGDDLKSLLLADHSARFFAESRLGQPLEPRDAPPRRRRDLLTVDERALYEAELPVVLAGDLQLHREAQEQQDELFHRICLERIVIEEHHFWWQAFIDDSTVYVASICISYDILNRWL